MSNNNTPPIEPPKEIWISKDSAIRLLPTNGISVGLNPLFSDDIKYISESHHNEVVDRKKFLIAAQRQSNELLEKENIQLKAEIERLMDTLREVSEMPMDVSPASGEMRKYILRKVSATITHNIHKDHLNQNNQ